MRRREFLVLVGATATWPLAAGAQPPERMRRIGVLGVFAEKDPEQQARSRALRQDLAALGWIEGRNVRIDHRFAAGDADRLQTLAKELVGLQPDVIVVSSTSATGAVLRETRTIPVVFTAVVDPVKSGFVASLARPGGNATGFSPLEYTMSGKWLELLKEIAPRVIRVAVIHHPENPAWPGYLRVMETVAPLRGIRLSTSAVHDAAEIEQALSALAPEPNIGLIVMPDVVTNTHRERIVALAARHRLPAVYPLRSYATSGGLMSYGPDLPEQARQAATYVDRILKGAKPADLPVQLPTTYEFVVNLKTAKTLGLDVPPSIRLRATEVIE